MDKLLTQTLLESYTGVSTVHDQPGQYTPATTHHSTSIIMGHVAQGIREDTKLTNSESIKHGHNIPQLVAAAAF